MSKSSRKSSKRLLTVVLVVLLMIGCYQFGAMTSGSNVDRIAVMPSDTTAAALSLTTTAPDSMDFYGTGRTADVEPTAIPTRQPIATPTPFPTATPTPLPTDTPAPTFVPLSRGASGAEVVQLQQRLNEIGYSAGTADGQFGKKTEAALLAFQSAAGLPATGVADDATQRLIYSTQAIIYHPTATPKPTAKPESRSDSSSGSGGGVWIPRTGQKYHSNSKCSNMKNPSLVSLSEAKRLGYTACKKCY